MRKTCQIREERKKRIGYVPEPESIPEMGLVPMLGSFSTPCLLPTSPPHLLQPFVNKAKIHNPLSVPHLAGYLNSVPPSRIIFLFALCVIDLLRGDVCA